MRDPNRINTFINKIQDYWKKYFPDWRFGQLMLNFMGWASQKHGDPFFWEEEQFLEYFQKYLEEGHSPFYKPITKE